ncbi:MAG: CocE/NonD family hydrolase [Lentisphaeria bacterium]|nr:CocE/NonD family hydrolase [Lentisphaeria bacterium]
MSQTQDIYNVTEHSTPFDISCTVRHVMVPMRDGVRLHTAVYCPPDLRKKAPVLLFRTPYTRQEYNELPDASALKSGWVYVLQACRGTGWSEGVFDPAEREQEKKDTEDLFVWMRKQSWFGGRCVMFGASYSGWTQWCAAASGVPELVGVSPRVAPLYSCTGSALPGGSFRFSFTLSWMLAMHHRTTYGYASVPDFEGKGLLKMLPVIDADRNAGYPELVPFRKFLKKALQPGTHLSQHASDFDAMRAPAFIAGGWFDGFKAETIESFQRMRKQAASAAARSFTRLTIGPWGHAGLLNPDLFGPRCDYRDMEKRRTRFLSNLLKNPEKDPLSAEPRVRYYSLGINQWKSSDCWPPKGVRSVRYYLHSGGNANSLNGDGVLNRRKPGRELPDTYVSNPADPVLCNNGRHAEQGCYDRIPMQKRDDVLVYTSPVFDKPLVLAGEVRLAFSASASTPDTDFVAVLSDVFPDGRAMFLTMGVIRARFRNSMDREELLKPGKVCRFEIDLSHIAQTFMPGHAMRLDIAGQYFPALDRNANTGGPILQDRELKTSIHTILHDAEHPAELILPVLA